MMSAANGLRLFVLDDDESVNFTICAIARTAGFETLSATDARSFFARLDDFQPTHLVIDLQIPEVDGIETLKQLAGLSCECNLIISSGLEGRVLDAAARIAREKGLRLSGILPKPFSANELKKMLLQSRAETSPGALQSEQQQRSTAYTELSRAINQNEITPHFQPKIACGSGELVGFECLARWQHPSQGMIYPDAFIPLAERSGLIGPLSRVVFSQAMCWLSENFASPDVKLALNMSARLLAEADTPLWLVSQCHHYSIDPRQIILEVTETSSLENPELVLEYLTQLRIKGFSLSIDDFGVGYSSLTQLARLPFSEMKVDKSFVMTAPQSQESRKIVEAIVGLAHTLGLTVTAEGVEDAWTLGMLGDIGCDAAQGFYITRPMSGSAALQWARTRPQRGKQSGHSAGSA